RPGRRAGDPARAAPGGRRRRVPRRGGRAGRPDRRLRMRNRRLPEPGLPPQPAPPGRPHPGVTFHSVPRRPPCPGPGGRPTDRTTMIDPSERVAVVGVGCVFPGAPDPRRFWSVVAAGVDATTEVPPGRWAVDPGAAYDPRV